MQISRQNAFLVLILVAAVYFLLVNTGKIEQFNNFFIGDTNSSPEPLIILPFKQQPFETNKGKYKPEWAKDALGDYQEYLYTLRQQHNGKVSLAVLEDDAVMSVSSEKDNNLYSTIPGISQRELNSNNPIQFKSF